MPSPEQIIVLALPAFLELIALEYGLGRYRGRDNYRLNDTLNSISLGIMSEVLGIFLVFFKIGIYSWVFDQLSLFTLSVDSPWVWGAGLLAYDFLYYWHHRADHTMAIFWASHVVHHQSEDFNLGTALRQPVAGPILGWVFYLPLAVTGIPPEVFGTVALIDLLYQFWVHTQHVKRLSWFDRWFCSPSNHRVHHAVNERYLDRNFGGILIIWDRLFGTFVEEQDSDPCVYGTRSPLRSWNPIWANFQVFWELILDSWRTSSVWDKVQIWFRRPGWRPRDVIGRWPKSKFEIGGRELFNPPVTLTSALIASSIFLASLIGASLLLWNAHQMDRLQLGLAAFALVGALWLVGVVIERPIKRRRA